MRRDPEAVVGWDADGVVIDSRLVAFQAAADIVALLGPAVQIGSRTAYNDAFGPAAQAQLVGESDAATLRAMHRLVMRARATRVAVFDDTLAVVRLLRRPPILITAAFSTGVRQALGDRAELFQDIKGRESGRKEALLAAAAKTMAVYITDTVRDIERCRDCGIPVVAVGWGYDLADDLLRAKPDCVVRNTGELARVLADRSLITANGGNHAP